MATEAREHTERAKPESLRLKKMAPGLTVDDIHESLRWYTDVVGFTLKDRWEHEGELHGAEIIAGDGYLMLGQDDWKKGRDRQKGEGFRLYLMTSQDVDEIAAGIKERGGELESEPQDMPWGGRAFSLVDPSGFKLTIASE
ncbi:MAG: VOC family protein [Longimicrobiales bacterium]|nr:VOC family protein [Longimicrobiales bacterium]